MLTKKQAYAKEYRLKHREERAEYNRVWRGKNREKYRKYLDEYWNRKDVSYRSYQRRAENTGRKFTLTIEDFKNLTSSECHYCGHRGRLGIDRKDNLVGYVLENSLPCCWPCNKVKGSMGYEYFINFCKKVYEHLHKM